MKRNTDLLPMVNFFAETLDDWDVSQAQVSRMTRIPSPHLTDMKNPVAAARRKNGEGL